jgi:hypothetical protein
MEMVFLNTKENIIEGMSATWFHYASLLLKEHPSLRLDFVSKVDSDTVIFPNRIVDFVLEEDQKERSHLLLYNKTRIYAGVAYSGELCDHCDKHLVGKSFMSGVWYFVSMDLARWITSQLSSEKRRALSAKGKDMSFATFVYSHPLSIQSLSLSKPHSHSLISHPIKWVKVHRNNCCKRSGFKRKEWILDRAKAQEKYD